MNQDRINRLKRKYRVSISLHAFTEWQVRAKEVDGIQREMAELMDLVMALAPPGSISASTIDFRQVND